MSHAISASTLWFWLIEGYGRIVLAGAQLLSAFAVTGLGRMHVGALQEFT